MIPYLEEEEPDAGETAQVVEEAVQQYDRIDVLVNNAAYQMYCERIQSLSPEELEHTYRTNIFSMFYLCKVALPHMRDRASQTRAPSRTTNPSLTSSITLRRGPP